MMDIDLQNRIARKMLETLLSYAKEFQETDTPIDPDLFGLTAVEFWTVADNLVKNGFLHRVDEETCAATAEGLAVAADVGRLDALFPVAGDPADPLPSEMAVFGSRPYEPASNVPPAMKWQDYESHVQRTWSRLLNSPAQQEEKSFQLFLEKHPCLLPGSYDCFRRGALPERCAYFAQPELPGFRAKRPDFMTITFDSDAVIATLIEIEAPGKRWTTQKGIQSHELTQAIDQLRDWKVWFNEPENVLQFTKLYGIDPRRLETRQFMRRYVLVFGRRSELEANPLFAKKRALLAQDDEVLMTYDRLRPSDRMGSCPTVRIDRSSPSHRFTVVHVPPTIQFGPHIAEDLSAFSGLREAISRNELMSQARRDFLIRRCDYWEEWLRKPQVMDVKPTFVRYYVE